MPEIDLEKPGKIVASKALPLRHIGNTLPRPYRFRPAADLAIEIEWAKNRRLTPQTYLSNLGQHEPPMPGPAGWTCIVCASVHDRPPSEENRA